MSDLDVRRGFRALVSGGASGLGDDELKTCIEALTTAQRERGNTPSVDEVLYLQEYLALCESHISYGVSQGDFDPSTETVEKLKELNAKYANISASVRKTDIIASSLDSELRNEGWMSSSYQC